MCRKKLSPSGAIHSLKRFVKYVNILAALFTVYDDDNIIQVTNGGRAPRALPWGQNPATDSRYIQHN